MLGGFFLALSYFGCDQSQVQRYLTGRSITESRLSLIFNAFVKVPMQFLILAIGVLMFVFYHFEKPPLNFNESYKRLLEAGAPAEYAELERRHDAAVEQRRESAIGLVEHDFYPGRSLIRARAALKPTGHLVIEVPRLDSLSYRLYGDRWPGLQAPQHMVLYTKETLLRQVQNAGLEVVDYLPYGAYPAYFYLFAGAAFKVLKGRGLDLGKVVLPYLFGQALLSPVLRLEKQLNLAMQTVVCRRRS